MADYTHPRFSVGDRARPRPEHDAEPPGQCRDFSIPALPRGEIVRAFPFGKGQVIVFAGDRRFMLAGMYERETECGASTK